MKIDVEHASVADVAECLLGGGLVLLPTDTVYGLAIAPNMPAAIDRLFKAKGRPVTRPLPLMIAGEEHLVAVGGMISSSARVLLRSEWMPGPVSIAVELDPLLKPAWLASRDELAVRIPAHRFCLGVIQATGPLFVTSANAHGEDTPETADAALAQLLENPDMVIDGGLLSGQPSTLVNCRRHPAVVERQGAVSAADVLERLRDAV